MSIRALSAIAPKEFLTQTHAEKFAPDFNRLKKLNNPTEVPQRQAIMPTNTVGHRCGVKYFFLSDGWMVGRVWEFGGLWNVNAWRRPPNIQNMNLCIVEQGEKMWLYQVEEAVLMVEVKPMPDVHPDAARTIGQVVLKRLITAEQALERLATAQTWFNPVSME